MIDITHEDKQTDLYRKMIPHLETRLQALRAQNDDAMPEDHRNRQIGCIAEVKRLLGLLNAKTPPVLNL